MKLNNCRLCRKMHEIASRNPELCSECIMMHEAQYKVILDRIGKRIGSMSFQEIAQKTDYEPQRVSVYLANRFGQAAKFVLLDSNRKGYCYICNCRVYYPLECACLDCLHRILAVLENRNLHQKSQMGTGRRVKLVLNVHTTMEKDYLGATWVEDEETFPTDSSQQMGNNAHRALGGS